MYTCYAPEYLTTGELFLKIPFSDSSPISVRKNYECDIMARSPAVLKDKISDALNELIHETKRPASTI